MDRKNQKSLLKEAIIQFKQTTEELIQMIVSTFDLVLRDSNQNHFTNIKVAQ
jgi:hypothetical protein